MSTFLASSRLGHRQITIRLNQGRAATWSCRSYVTTEMDRPEGTTVHGMTMDTDYHYTAGSRAAVFVAVLDHFSQPPLVFLKPLTTCVSVKATQSAKGTLFTFKVFPKVSDDALVVVFSKQAYHASENGHCDLRWRKCKS